MPDLVETAKRLIGKAMQWPISPEITVYVTILNVKSAYGHTRCMVRPVAGTGSKWVEEYSLKPLPAAAAPGGKHA